MKNWCLGFIFSLDFSTVLLLKKSQTMHIGLWNGIGGKIEYQETPIDAMIRECKEEAQLDIAAEKWLEVGRLKGVNSGEPWCVHLFVTTYDTHGMNEITADWAANATKDTPFRFHTSELVWLDLAPYTELLVVAARAKGQNPKLRPIIVAEV